MRASRRPLPEPPRTVSALVVLVLACSRLLHRSAAVAAEAEGGLEAGNSSSSHFFDARLAERASALSSLLAAAEGDVENGGGGEAKNPSSSSLAVRVLCEPDRFLPAKRMPATVSLPRLVGRFEGGSCRARGGGREQ